MERVVSEPDPRDGPAPRRNQGSAHPRAKLTDDEVRNIRASHLSHRTIAAELGISRSHVINIRAGRRWPHLGE